MALNQFYPYQYPYQQTQQSGGLISGRSIEEAYNYPIAPGNSITFKDETQPFVYTKTKGFSPLEQPVFEKYRLVKVEDMPAERTESPQNGFDAQGEIKLLWDEINAVKAAIKEAHNDQFADAKPVQSIHGKSGSVHDKDGRSARLAK